MLVVDTHAFNYILVQQWLVLVIFFLGTSIHFVTVEWIYTHMFKILEFCLLRCHLHSLRVKGGAN